MAEPIEDAESPWTALKGVTRLRVAPLAAPLAAKIMVPGSKSFSNRALILAAMAKGTSHLTGLLKSDDTYWCADALKRLGAQIAFDGHQATITGLGRRRPASAPLHVGSGGTVARFLPTFLAAGEAGEWRVTASKQMSRRPVGPLFAAMAEGGAQISFLGEKDCYPVEIEGDTFEGGALSMAGNVSSQFISGLLMGSVQAVNGLDLTVTGGIVQPDYVRITLDLMEKFGVLVTVNDGFDRFAVPSADYKGTDLAVEADASTATYFAALAAVTGGDITLLNIGKATLQPDYGFIETLERMGCAVERGETTTRIVGTDRLKGGFSIDMTPNSDATLTLAAIAPFADGPITMTGVAHIRHHETDRIAAICAELSKAGIKVEEHEDGLTVHPGTPKFAVLDTHEDHRMAMALSVLGAAGAGVELTHPACVSKTCPSFFDNLSGLGIGVEITGQD